MMMIYVLRPILCTWQAKWAKRPSKVMKRGQRCNNLQNFYSWSFPFYQKTTGVVGSSRNAICIWQAHHQGQTIQIRHDGTRGGQGWRKKNKTKKAPVYWSVLKQKRITLTGESWSAHWNASSLYVFKQISLPMCGLPRPWRELNHSSSAAE